MYEVTLNEIYLVKIETCVACCVAVTSKFQPDGGCSL